MTENVAKDVVLILPQIGQTLCEGGDIATVQLVVYVMTFL